MKRNLAAAVLIGLVGAGMAHAQSLQGLPAGPLGQSIQSGYDMMMHTTTNPEVKRYVGNDLTCSNCHINGGNTAAPGNFRETATELPNYSKRENTVITLEDRIANCFMRSMNGIRPSTDSKVIVDMTAYIDWLDRGKPIETPPAPPSKPSPYPAMLRTATHADVVAGAAVYKTNCAACHGATGAGTPGTFPPVWGDKSYNAGAGLANPVKLATWVKGNMPLGNPHLTEQEAFQVAMYIDTHPRPDFVLSKHLPANAPADEYNASVRAETDSVASNFKKAGLSLQSLTGAAN
ncbi:c-type cytochrome [Acidocella aminolytica]|jgi:thiosulfate dehydrogenase|uniref:Cytochrome c class I n=1 Tax=Acidocella aminolytica 101 = DSM 11237 TaxID=1120923 RepID=A0A0D6PJ22_9PROT|nr:c-type cytochrome [Acidocella aminolytica]GAN81391.1 cytochrome c class I [Acidocella aminolytica 101 = DSM 11237]GBQ40854.1 cytochrome c [Acidocella aminolytica 101 = DSM 11237]SHF32569.1 Cytochrome c [Acidocella aminolytica 101 = DSM 11237]